MPFSKPLKGGGPWLPHATAGAKTGDARTSDDFLKQTSGNDSIMRLAQVPIREPDFVETIKLRNEAGNEPGIYRRRAFVGLADVTRTAFVQNCRS